MSYRKTKLFFPGIKLSEATRKMTKYGNVIMKQTEMINRKLALSHDILMSVEKPARYIGGEHNSVMKNREEIAIRFAMCFPDIYEIGMSHLGLSILYGMFNAMENVWCERVFSPG